MLDSSSIPIGEYEVDGTIVRVNRQLYGTVIVHQISPSFRRIGYLRPDGHHDGRLLETTLAAVVAGAEPVVRCPTCQTILDAETSKREVAAGTWRCSGLDKPAAEGRAS